MNDEEFDQLVCEIEQDHDLAGWGEAFVKEDFNTSNIDALKKEILEALIDQKKIFQTF